MERIKVLVCGATGFVGRNVTETLAQRPDLEVHAVRFTRPAYDCPGVTWHQADLRDANAVAAVIPRMDVVIQAAATTSGAAEIVARPYVHVTDNAVMNSLLLRACYDHAVKHFVFFSCSIMYPSAGRPWLETDWDAGMAIHPRYFGAAWTKIYLERMCEFYARLGKTRHTVVRHTNIYGPYDKFDLERSHVFGATVTKVMTNQDGRIVVWGTGEEARDLLYVDDLVDFVERAFRNQTAAYEMFHASSGIAVPVKDLVRMIVQASGRDLRIEHDHSKPSIATSLSLNSTRAAEMLGWRPRVPLEEGIRRTLAWWTANFGHPAAPP